MSLFEQLISDGQTALVVLEFTADAAPGHLGRAAHRGLRGQRLWHQPAVRRIELVVMQAAGMSPWRLARPVLVFGILVALMVAMLVHSLVPLARPPCRPAGRDRQNVTAQFLRAGSFQYPVPGASPCISATSQDDGRLVDFFLRMARPERGTSPIPRPRRWSSAPSRRPAAGADAGHGANLSRAGGGKACRHTLFRTGL